LRQLEDGLDNLGLSWIPSVGNFICLEIPGLATPINQGLLENGVIVRAVANYEMPDHLRVSIGTEKENEIFLAKLKLLLSQQEK
jgi:histidinol-phosphate aminotransferase